MANTIHKIRPSLHKVAPLTYANVVLFVWLNLFIAFSLYEQRPNASLVVVSGVFNSYFWAGMFVFLSLGHLLGLVTNNWRLVRKFLMLGLFVKAILAYALIILGLKIGFKSTLGTTALWMAITWVQFFTLKYFDKQKVLNDD